MARSAIEHNEQMMVRIVFGEPFEETLQATAVHPRKIKAVALPIGGIYGRIEIGPLVGTPHCVGRTKAFWAVASCVPVDQTEACLVKSQNLQWLSRAVGLFAPL